MEKNGTFASPATALANGSCPWRADEEHALRDLRADRRIATRIFQEIHHFGELFLHFHLFPLRHQRNSHGPGLPQSSSLWTCQKLMTRPPPPCVWFMIQNHTPTRMMIDSEEQIHPPGRLFQRFAVMMTPPSESFGRSCASLSGA